MVEREAFILKLYEAKAASCLLSRASTPAVYWARRDSHADTRTSIEALAGQWECEWSLRPVEGPPDEYNDEDADDYHDWLRAPGTINYYRRRMQHLWLQALYFFVAFDHLNQEHSALPCRAARVTHVQATPSTSSRQPSSQRPPTRKSFVAYHYMLCWQTAVQLVDSLRATDPSQGTAERSAVTILQSAIEFEQAYQFEEGAVLCMQCSM